MLAAIVLLTSISGGRQATADPLTNLATSGSQLTLYGGDNFFDRTDWESAVGNSFNEESFDDGTLLPDLTLEFASLADGDIVNGHFEDTVDGSMATVLTFASPVSAFGGIFDLDPATAGTGLDLHFQFGGGGEQVVTVRSNANNDGYTGFVGVISSSLIERVEIFEGDQTSLGQAERYDGDNIVFAGPQQVVGGDACFEPPMDLSPVTVKKNRVLPFKCRLLDADGYVVTDLSVSSPPVIQVLFHPAIGDAYDVTDEALAAGQGMDGNQFEFHDSVWQFNLKTKNYTATGTYTVSIVSGDQNEYVIDPVVQAEFVVME